MLRKPGQVSRVLFSFTLAEIALTIQSPEREPPRQVLRFGPMDYSLLVSLAERSFFDVILADTFKTTEQKIFDRLLAETDC